MLLTLENTGQLLVAAGSMVTRTLAKHHLRGKHRRDCVWCSKCHILGPLGVELKRNLVSQWWNSVVLYREQVLGIDTLHHLAICTHHLKELPRDQLDTWLEDPAGELGVLRHELLYGSLLEYVPSMELLNKKLLFGLAEIGKCFHSVQKEGSKGTVHPRIGERTVAFLVWFSSPKSSGQWQEYWLRQRLQWWQKGLMLGESPSGFRCNDFQDEQGGKRYMIQYEFPWGRETIETLCNLDDSALLQMHSGCTTKLQVAYFIDGDLDRGILAYLSDALQQMEGPPLRGQYHQREILKLHPTLHGSLEQRYTKYDEMGVLFTVLVIESMLENGLIQVYSRDTTLKETIHVSKVKDFLVRYIAAAGNL
ncbi:hypothetical protein XELAEV_18046870mg [Xenopus laevis]|uniref:Anticodon-binding domain-containing protein n=1 Tax=Xenopus laevis TaxID=8355 RepID=A0A974BU09_XENLA|nr:hypothetical protein XELAEV_18046870mg [Xenopus laevis]